MDSIPTIKQLKALSISGNKIQTLQGINRFEQLRFLNVASNPIEDMKGIQ